MRNFRVFWFCSKMVEKNPIQVWNLENFSSKTPTRRGLFLEKKIQRISLQKCFTRDFLVYFKREIQSNFFFDKKASPCRCFWTKIFRISNLESDFFLIKQQKHQMFQIIRNLFILSYSWAIFQQNQRTFFSHHSFIIIIIHHSSFIPIKSEEV